MWEPLGQCAVRSVCITALEPIIDRRLLAGAVAAATLVEHAAVLQRPGDKLFELVGVERLFDVIESAVPHGFDRRGDRGMGRDHQHLGAVRPMLELANEFQAATCPASARSVITTS